MMTLSLILIVGSYLLGSVPFGFMIARFHGIDLRKIGSGNIGATNLGRAMGRKWAYVCFFLDAGKGLSPTILAVILSERPPTTAQLAMSLAAGCAAIIGHIYPVFLRFKGGKGVATSFGVALGLWPYYTLCAAAAFVVWLIFLLIWRYVSLASIAASVAFPLVLCACVVVIPGWDISRLWPLLAAAAAIPLMVILRHRENMKRLLNGTESKVFQPKADTIRP